MDTITMEDIFGKPFDVKGTIMGYKEHGYNLKSGGWSLYPDKDGSSTVAKFLIFRKSRHRKTGAFNVNEIINLRKEQP